MQQDTIYSIFPSAFSPTDAPSEANLVCKIFFDFKAHNGLLWILNKTSQQSISFFSYFYVVYLSNHNEFDGWMKHSKNTTLQLSYLLWNKLSWYWLCSNKGRKNKCLIKINKRKMNLWNWMIFRVLVFLAKLCHRSELNLRKRERIWQFAVFIWQVTAIISPNGC